MKGDWSAVMVKRDQVDQVKNIIANDGSYTSISDYVCQAIGLHIARQKTKR